MKLLANENFPLLAIRALRDAGHDVIWVRTALPGESDTVILRHAQNDDRLVLTFDKDFGELTFRYGLPATCGILLFRLHTQSPEHVRDRVLATIAERTDWTGHLFIIEEHRIRARPLPAAKHGQ